MKTDMNMDFIKRLSRAAFTLVFVMLMANTLSAQLRRTGYNKPGYRNITELGMMIPSDNAVLGYTIRTVNGYQVNPYFSGGIGLGAEIYGSEVLASGFLDLRYYMFEESFTPFLYGQGGYAMGISNDLGGGPLAAFGAGVEYWASKKAAALFGIGYKSQWLPGFVQTENGVEESMLATTSFTWQLGFAF